MEKYVEMFQRIKHEIDTGQDINQLFDGVSYLYRYIDTYYQHSLYNESDTMESEPFPQTRNDEISGRNSTVFEHLNRFVEHRADFNKGESERPLMLAVENADAAMTEYMLSHGASTFYNECDEAVPYGGGLVH